MRPWIRTFMWTFASFLMLGRSTALADPFYSAGVAGVADANDSSRPCALPGQVGEGYRTYPLDAFMSFAEGEAEGFNPCSALSGSAHSYSSANLASGQLRVFALAQIGQNGFTQEARANAYFSDDVTLLSGSGPVSSLPNGVFGEIRLDIHGTRSAQLVAADASLDVTAANGVEIGSVDAEDLQGGESLVVLFNQPFHFFAILGVIAGDGEFANFGSTGTISISLPEGYTFASTSGVLLMPEPDAFSSIAAAVCTIAALRRRRRA